MYYQPCHNFSWPQGSLHALTDRAVANRPLAPRFKPKLCLTLTRSHHVCQVRKNGRAAVTCTLYYFLLLSVVLIIVKPSLIKLKLLFWTPESIEELRLSYVPEQ